MRPAASARQIACWPIWRAIAGRIPTFSTSSRSARARRGDGEEARTRLAAVVALRPDVPSLQIELARLLEGAGDTQRAVATFGELAARLPDEPSALVALGKLCIGWGRTTRRSRRCERRWSCGPRIRS